MKIAEGEGWMVFRAPYDENGKRQLVFHHMYRDEMWTLFIGTKTITDDPGLYSPLYKQEVPCWHKAGADEWSEPPWEIPTLFRKEIDAFLAQQRLSGAWDLNRYEVQDAPDFP